MMEQQLVEEAASKKVSRAKARRIRHKRLKAAQKAAEGDCDSIETSKFIEQSTSETARPIPSFESTTTQDIPATLTKSKAKRLRKKNRGDNLNPETPNSDGNNSSDNISGDAAPEATGASASKSPTDTVQPELTGSPKRPSAPKNAAKNCPRQIKQDIESDIENRNQIQDPNPPVGTLTSTELLENAKNLKHTGLSFGSIDFGSTLYSNFSTSELIDDSHFSEIQGRRIIIDPEAPFGTDSCENRAVQKRSRTPDLLESIVDSNSVPVESIDTTDRGSSTLDSQISSIAELKMEPETKSREQIKAEREAKKAAKAAAKGKTKKGDNVTAAIDVQQSDKNIKPQEQAKVAPRETEIKSKVQGHSEKSGLGQNQENVPVEKSKAELRAERRAKQEAQRAAKEQQVADKSKKNPAKGADEIKSRGKESIEIKKVKDGERKVVKKVVAESNPHEVKHFKHLYHEREQSLANVPSLNSNIHPAIVRLGVRYASKVIVGSNARCVALMVAISRMIRDFERPPQADFTRSLEANLQECAAYLQHCRPMAVSMQNALRHLKWQMTQLPATISDDEARTKLENAISTYIREQIELAGRAISNTIQTKISDGDVILTYAFSSLIHNILIDAHKAGSKFRVIVVDGRPWLEGKEQLRRLVRHGIECSYVLINALSFIMPEVTKVFLGAHAILANGAVMSRAGTAQVALMAKAFNVPVLVACETHKSCERVQTDSFVYNEIGDADELARHSSNNSRKSTLANWKTKKSLDLLNIIYDVTPADLVTAVVTELAILPCTSVPVILRIKPSEI